jgi:carbonic anhydrase
VARSGAIAVLVPLTLTAAVLTFSGPAAQSAPPRQSPIDITAESVRVNPALPALQIGYGHSDIELSYVRKDAGTPNGCTTRHHEETEEAEVQPGSAHVTLSGVRYDLVQFHFHTPSEHRLGGHAAPLEMHLVHRSAAGRLLVIGIPLLPGRGSTVDTVLARPAAECGDPIHVGEIDLNSLLPADRTSLRYDGSLTTAPFTEGVQWFLMRDKTVSQATISRFQSLFVHGNARATQPLNGRTVQAERPHI